MLYMANVSQSPFSVGPNFMLLTSKAYGLVGNASLLVGETLSPPGIVQVPGYSTKNIPKNILTKYNCTIQTPMQAAGVGDIFSTQRKRNRGFAKV